MVPVLTSETKPAHTGVLLTCDPECILHLLGHDSLGSLKVGFLTSAGAPALR
jgi:hypothetical protein